jgi:cytochrome c oxidase subunit III
MGAVVEFKPEVAVNERQRELTGAIGMMIALGSWAMMFACVFFVYLALRSRALSWPPPGFGALPLVLPSLSTAVLLASSATLAYALKRLRLGERKAALRGILATFALGVGFVFLQTMLWRQLIAEGITVQTGTIGMVLYTLTGLHAAHVAMGIVALAYLVVATYKSADGVPLRRKAGSLRLCGMFWHFVDAVWVLMFIGLFVV